MNPESLSVLFQIPNTPSAFDCRVLHSHKAHRLQIQATRDVQPGGGLSSKKEILSPSGSPRYFLGEGGMDTVCKHNRLSHSLASIFNQMGNSSVQTFFCLKNSLLTWDL